MNFSFWEKETWWDDIDVLVVGAGLTGLSTAIHLKEDAPHLRVVVIDRSPWMGGASTRNAGFACFGSPTELLADIESMGWDDTFRLVAQRYKGMMLLRTKIGDAAIRYVHCGGHELFLDTDQESLNHCVEKLDDLNKGLADILPQGEIFTAPTPVPAAWGWKAGTLIGAPAEGRIHPGFMLKSLIDQAYRLGIVLLPGVEMTKWEDQGDRVKVSLAGWGEVTCGKLCVTTNGFFPELNRDHPIVSARNQVMITAPIPALTWDSCFHYQQGYGYFRRVGDRILIGGFRNRDLEGESTGKLGLNHEIQGYLRNWLGEVVLPGVQFKVERQWSGILGVGPAKQPIVKYLSSRVVMAVRLGGMGVALGTLLGQGAAKLLLDKEATV